jgi:hypothetical protein
MLIKIIAGFAVGVLLLFSACTIAVLNAGVGSVHINSDEVTLWLPVPVLAADLALYLTPADVIMDIRENLYPWKDLILSSVSELAECPDATFVEIDANNERILVKKDGTDLIVDVDSQTEGKIYVELPIRSVERILSFLVE